MHLVPIPLGERPRIEIISWMSHLRPVDRWYLPDRWCLHAYRYHADLVVDGQRFALAPGRVSVLPAGTRQEYRYGVLPARHLYCHFHPGPGAGGVPARVPLVSDLGAEADGFLADFAQALHDDPFDRLRAEVRLWDLLWRLVRLGEAAEDDARPVALRQVIAQVDEHLDQPLAVAALAAGQGLSHNTLTRLFRAHLGTTVVGWIRRRRAERARDLLRHSDLPVAEIARRVGQPDLHHFNRLLREILGRGPRDLRRRRPEVVPPAGAAVGHGEKRPPGVKARR